MDPAVTAGWIDGVVRLTVLVRDNGQRFAKGTGTVTCSQGDTTRSFGFFMDTVLPGQGRDFRSTRSACTRAPGSAARGYSLPAAASPPGRGR